MDVQCLVALFYWLKVAIKGRGGSKPLLAVSVKQNRVKERKKRKEEEEEKEKEREGEWKHATAAWLEQSSG